MSVLTQEEIRKVAEAAIAVRWTPSVGQEEG
jgi:hypothetical protein